MKKITFWIIIIVLTLLFIGCLLLFTNWTKDTKDLLLQYLTFVVTAVGFIVAIYQLRISINQYFEGVNKRAEYYLELSLEVKSYNSLHSLKTQVSNKSGEDKYIDYAFLLINKQESDILSIVNQIINSTDTDYKVKVEASNDFVILKSIINQPYYLNNEAVLIPLEFYYTENIKIGNENPAYTFTLDNIKEKLKVGIYSVRFFVFPKNYENNNNYHYHRSTVESLIIT